jgi:integrase
VSARRRQFGAIRKLPSGRWQASYFESGRRHIADRTFPSRADASAWLATVEADLLRGDWLDPRGRRGTVAEWSNLWLESTMHLKPKTRESYESTLRVHVLPAFGHVAVGSIERSDAEQFLGRLTKDGASPGLVANARLVLRLVLGTAVNAKALRSNPCDGIRAPRQRRGEMHFLTHEQVAALARTIVAPPIRTGGGEHRRRTYPEWGLLVLTAAYTGLRAGELAALRVGRTDLTQRRLVVAESVSDVAGVLTYGPPKTYQFRSVPMPGFLVELMREHLRRRPRDVAAFVFTSPDGGPLRHLNFYKRFFKPALAPAGLPEAVRFHDLRHTYASFLIAEGAHPRAMMERLGHSSVTVTLDRYGHLLPGLESQLTAALDERARALLEPLSPSVRSLGR